MSEPHHTTTPWIALFRAQKRARAKIDGAMKAANLPSLECYDVLWELEKAAPEGLRPFELEQALLLPQHGVSRLTSQMVRNGLLQRLPCANDKRGFRLSNTPTGQKLRHEMWAIYAPIMQHSFPADLDAAQSTELARMLNQIAKL